MSCHLRRLVFLGFKMAVPGILFRSRLRLSLCVVVRATSVRLIAELRRLGACVVFASFQKVIIATNKSDVKAARDYAKFVVSTVTSRDLFNTLQVLT